MGETPFGRYRLVELLGRGGMGEVWRAYDTGTDRMLAVKVLLEHFASDPTYEQRFRREAQAAARLDSPHVVPIYDYGEIDGRLFVAMRLISGRDLASVIADGPLPPTRAVKIVDQIAKALHSAHRVGLVHRDVKPSNILLDEDDYAYLIDFGIARAATDTGLTGTGSMIGTWAYMSPERFTTDEIDPRADVYALACVFYECLTGFRPYPGDSLERQVAGHLQTPPPRPSAFNPRIPATLDGVIATGMAKDPGKRYRSTKDLGIAAAAAVTAPEQTRPIPNRASGFPPDVPTIRHRPPSAPRQAVPNPPPNPPTRQPVPPPQPSAPKVSTPNFAAAHPAPTPPAPAPTPPKKSRAKLWAAIGVAAIVLCVIAVGALFAFRGSDEQSTTQPGAAQTTAAQTSAATPTSGAGPTSTATVGAETVLPIDGLYQPSSVAVNGGDVYVVDPGNNRVLELAAGSTSAEALPFDGLQLPFGVTVGNDGTVYVTDSGNRRVLALAANETAPRELPFPSLNQPEGIAVDDAGAVYVADTGQIYVLTAGADAPTQIDAGTGDIGGIAVDDSGTVYVADTQNSAVLAIPRGSASTPLPFGGISTPRGIAIDGTGTVYVTTVANEIVSLASGASSSTVLPFSGLSGPRGVAVSDDGTVYVADTGNDRVVSAPTA